MSDQHITVFYSWKAKEGQLETLTQIYTEVMKHMEANEPGALAAEFFVDETNNSIVVRDLFADGGAVGFHLRETAAKHFESLMQIATPGTFYFCGDVPQELQQAVVGMGLPAQFSTRASGFAK